MVFLGSNLARLPKRNIEDEKMSVRPTLHRRSDDDDDDDYYDNHHHHHHHNNNNKRTPLF